MSETSNVNDFQESFIEEMQDIIEPSVETETGNDDFVFGNYIQWPAYGELSDDVVIR